MSGWATAIASGLYWQRDGAWAVAILALLVALFLVATGWYVADGRVTE